MTEAQLNRLQRLRRISGVAFIVLFALAFVAIATEWIVGVCILLPIYFAAYLIFCRADDRLKAHRG